MKKITLKIAVILIFLGTFINCTRKINMEDHDKITKDMPSDHLAHVQQKAVTETGEEVILFEDGTWKYQNEDDFLIKEISTNSNIFQKDKESTFLLKSSKVNVGIYLNPKTWSFESSPK